MKITQGVLVLLAAAFACAPRVTAGQSGEADSAAPTRPTVPAAAPAADGEHLWIAVHLGESGQAGWVGESTEASFADLVAKNLRAQGFKGRITALRREDLAPSRSTVLIIRLSAWTTSDGVSDCRFNASLRSAEGDRDLGPFAGDNVIVTADGEHHFSVDGLVGSAQEAMNDLYLRVLGTGLLKHQ